MKKVLAYLEKEKPLKRTIPLVVFWVMLSALLSLSLYQFLNGIHILEIFARMAEERFYAVTGSVFLIAFFSAFMFALLYIWAQFEDRICSLKEKSVGKLNSIFKKKGKDE